MILEVAHVDTFYGTSHVLQSIDLSVSERESVALLGRNGVGKTTTLRTIMGLAPGRAGSVRFLGREIRGQPADTVARLGIAYVPDDHRIFPTLTADENRGARAAGTASASWNCSPSSASSDPPGDSIFLAARRRCWPSGGR